MRKLIILILLLGSATQVAAFELRVFDFRGKCLNVRGLEAIANLPKNASLAQIPGELRQFIVTSESQMSRKTANASRNIKRVMTFFENELRWRSVDGRGTPVFFLTNLQANMGQGCDPANAFWVTFSNGRAKIISVLAHPQYNEDIGRGLEILAHEFGHGVFRETMGDFRALPYMSALTEGVGDMYGVSVKAWHESNQNLQGTVVRRNTFHVGKDFVDLLLRMNPQLRSEFEGGYLRDNLNPGSRGEFGYYDRRVSNLNVYNAEILARNKYKIGAIASRAYALLVAGKARPDRQSSNTFRGIGVERSVKILHYTLKYRIPFNDLPSFSRAMFKSAKRIHGNQSEEAIAVYNAFEAVGLKPASRPPQLQSKQPKQQQTETEQQDTNTQEQETTQQPENQQSDSQETQSQQTENQQTESQQTETTQQPPAQTPSNSQPQSSNKLIFVLFPALVVALLIGLTIAAKRRRLSVEKANQQNTYRGEGASRQPEPAKPQKPSVQVPVIKHAHEKQPSPPQKMDQKTQPLHAAHGSNEVVVDVRVGAVRQRVSIGENACAIGRTQSNCGNRALSAEIEKDSSVSRHHCDIWVSKSKKLLYIRCFSINGMKVDEHQVPAEQKVSIDFSKTVALTLGSTMIQLSPNW